MSFAKSFAEASVKQIMKSLPLPISLPTTLVRTKKAITDAELTGRRAFVLHLRDALDEAIVQELFAQGANVRVLDATPDRAILERLHRPHPQGATIDHSPVTALDPDTLTEALGGKVNPDGPPAPPAILVHRFTLATGEDVADAVLASLDPLYAVGQAAARALPRGSRILYVMPPQGTHAAATIAQSSVEGFARALGKELGKQGTTVHVLRPGQGSPRGFAKVAAFLSGPRSSFLHLLSLDVDQDVRAQPIAEPVPGTGAKKRALEGKVALITGAGRGIGAAVAEALAREGADIAINDLPSAERSASRVLARLRKLGVRAAFLPFDVATKEGVTELRAAIGAEFGRLDILVNNAGITRDKTLKRMKRELWDLGVKVNLGSQLRVTEAVEDLLQPGGAVVNLSSVMGIAGNFGQTNYSAAKAGVIGFTKVLAERLGQRGVTVNALAPGYIKTRLTHQMPLLNREMAKQLTALLQPGEAEDIADIITFLASPDGASVHGQVIRVDGGMAIGK